MNHLEEEFKKRLTDARSNEGIDEEKLWADISNALSETQPAGHSWFLPTLFLSVGLAMLTVVWFFFVNQTALQKNTSAPTAQIMESPEHQKAQQQVDLKMPIRTTAANGIFEKESGAVSTVQKMDGHTKTLEYPFIKPETPFATMAKELDPEHAQIEAQQAFDFQENKTKTQTNYPTESTEKNLQLIPTKRQEISLIQLFPLLKVNHLREQHFPEMKKTKLPAVASIMLPKKQRAKKWELGLLSGVNYFSQNLQGKNNVPDFEKILGNSHHAETGYQFSGEIHWKPTSYLRFGTGFGYVSARTTFDFVQEWDTVMHRNNVQTAELINARATRTVEHHNRQDYLSLPLTVGVTKELGKFGLGLDLGIGLNYFIAQSGKSLNDEERIVEFDNQTSENQPFSKLFFSALINPYLEFMPSRQYSLRLRPSFRVQQHGVSELYGLKVSSVLWGLNLGVFRRF